MYALNGKLGSMTRWVTFIQLATHLSILNIRKPGNMQIFDSHLLPITEFDPLSSDKTASLFFDFEEFKTGADEAKFNLLVPSQA
jgi:hypothetical protein